MEKMAASFQTKIYQHLIKLSEQFIKLSCMNFYKDLTNKNITESETEKRVMDKQIDEHKARTTVMLYPSAQRGLQVFIKHTHMLLNVTKGAGKPNN